MSVLEGKTTVNTAGGLVGIGLVVILAFVTWALVFREVPEANQNALTLLIGILSANVGMVVGYFFGSSSTNKKQSDTIDTQAQTIRTAGVALNSADPANTPDVVLTPGDNVNVEATE